jgi:RNA polymerase sigma-70 factor (sigma-E family)
MTTDSPFGATDSCALKTASIGLRVDGRQAVVHQPRRTSDQTGPDESQDPMKVATSFSEFVRTRSAALTCSAFLLTGDRHLSEDLVQTALGKAMPRWAKIADNPEPYVRRILYHEHVSVWRRRRVAEDLMPQVPDRGHSQSGFDADTIGVRMVVHRALARLTPRQRAVLVLRYFEDLPESRTAALLNCSVGTVKSQTRHALRRLRELCPELAELGTRPGQAPAVRRLEPDQDRAAA